MRIKTHPILKFEKRKKLEFTFDGRKLYGYEGETIAASLHASSVKVLGKSLFSQRPRGFYCAIGNCSSCNMVVNGESNVRTCITELKEGMDIKTQVGKGNVL